MRGANKDVREALKYAKENGFEISRSNNHIVLKRGVTMISMSQTPSDRNGPKRAMRDIRKAIYE